MPWMLWVLLCFQGRGEISNDLNLKGLDAVRQDTMARESMRRSLLDDKAGAASARRAAQAINEREFVNRFNRFMHAMADFARAYDEQHSVDLKRLKVVKQALRDLENNDEWFKDLKKK